MEIAWVTPYPTWNSSNSDDVLIPVKIWSAFASMIATLKPFAHDPGFFDAKVTPLIVFSSYPSWL